MKGPLLKPFCAIALVCLLAGATQAGAAGAGTPPTAKQIAQAVRQEKEQVLRIVGDRDRAARIVALIDRRQLLAARLAQDNSELGLRQGFADHAVSAAELQRVLALHQQRRRELQGELLATLEAMRAEATPEEWAGIVRASAPSRRLGERWLAAP
ncbi:MAG TPA: hypothetical protein VGK67_28955 [Myxococcales bacterium]|jgi:uncharacterized protein YjeT (DUF2065 family)